MVQLVALLGVVVGTSVMLIMIFRGENPFTAILTAAIIIFGFGLAGLGFQTLLEKIIAAF